MPDDSDTSPTFRRASADEAPAILRVLESAFERWPAFAIDVTPLEHLLWKLTPPTEPPPQHAVIESGGEIVGVQLRWTGCMDLCGSELPFDFGVDMSVHASARGRGLGSMLRDSEAERLFGQRTIGFDTISVNQQVVDMYEGRQPVRRELSYWTRPLTIRAFIAVHRSEGPTHLATAALRAVRGLRRSPARRMASRHGSLRIEPVEVFDTRADELWERIRGEYELARVRDATWLNWRYADPRAGQIRAYEAVEGERLLGYAAFRRNGSTGRVLDLVTDPGAPGVGPALLNLGCAELRRAGCASVESILPPGHRDEAALEAAGFLRRGDGLAAQVTRARNQSVPEILEVFGNPNAPIHLMYGDFDHG